MKNPLDKFDKKFMKSRGYGSFMKDAGSMYRCRACCDQRYTTFPKLDHAQAKRCSECIDDCDECGGEGFTFKEKDNGYRYAAACDYCANLDNRIAYFNKAKLPARYHNKTFESFLPHHNGDPQRPNGNLPSLTGYIMQRAGSFYDKYERGILMTGGVGSGKTHLLVALIRHLALEKGIKCRFAEFTHLLSDLRSSYDRKSGSGDLLKTLSEVPVLAIDELGKGRNNDWQISIIDELISKRYNRSLPTFCTTNYPLYSPHKVGLINTESQDFKKDMEKYSLTDRIGERIVSRLVEMMDVAEFKSVEDYRKLSFRLVEEKP